MAPLVTLSGPTMGTRFVVRAAVADADVDRLTALLQAAVDRVDLQMSTWKPLSDLCRFNGGMIGRWIDIPPEMASVIATGLAVSESTGGAFDMTLGRLVELWGFGPTGPVTAPPSQASIAEALALGGYRKLTLRADRAALSKGAPLHLDLNGLAKGFGVDELARVIIEAGISDFLAEIDGELRVSGRRPDGSDWRIAVALPVPHLAAAYGAITPGTRAVATSGDYRRFFAADGRHYSHTIDPRTGCPVVGGPASVTVLNDSCARADAIASALMVMRVADGMAWARENEVTAVWLERGDGAIVSHTTGDVAVERRS